VVVFFGVVLVVVFVVEDDVVGQYVVAENLNQNPLLLQ
jgi:hypothetical protein